MAYYLGRDVTVNIKTEHGTAGIDLNGGYNTDPTVATWFASDNADSGITVGDLTGVDIGIGVQDEDITYMGKKSVLKAEIKKETTLSLTRKKSTALWEKVFNVARWGADSGSIHLGLSAPPADGSYDNYGYKIAVNMSAASDVLTLRNCTITGHTVSLNADGTAEETLEFVTQVAPAVSG